MQTAIPELLKKITFIPNMMQKNIDKTYVSAIAYPDDGAYKRFGKMNYFSGVPAIICAKIRDKDARKIIIRDIINENIRMWDGIILIIDDLVQSGGTLRECRNAIISHREGKVNVAAFCSHGVFPRESWKRFVEEMDKPEHFTKFYVTNSIETTNKLKGIAPFEILELEHTLAADLHRAISGKDEVLERCDGNCLKYKVFVSSENRDKSKAAHFALVKFGVNTTDFSIHGKAVSSGIPEQPLGKEQTEKGARNRLNSILEELKKSDEFNLGNANERVLIFSFENGVIEEDGIYYDAPCVCILDVKTKSEACAWGEKIAVPNEFMEIVKKEEQKITIGNLFNKEMGWPSGSWHKFLNAKERWHLMADTALEALKNLKV